MLVINSIMKFFSFSVKKFLAKISSLSLWFWFKFFLTPVLISYFYFFVSQRIDYNILFAVPLVFLFFKMQPRFLIFGAMLLLFGVVLTYSLGDVELAENLAVYTYLLLILFLILEFVNFIYNSLENFFLGFKKFSYKRTRLQAKFKFLTLKVWTGYIKYKTKKKILRLSRFRPPIFDLLKGSRIIKTSVLFFVIFILNFWLFSFESYPIFRDFQGLPYHYNQNFSYNLSSVFKFSNNLLTDIKLGGVWFYQFSFAFYLSLSWLFIYLGLKNLIIGLKDFYPEKIKYPQIILLVSSLFGIYNIWVFERILMGQMGIILGYALFVLNLSFLFLLYIKFKSQPINISFTYSKECFKKFLNNFETGEFAKLILFLFLGILFSTLINPHHTILFIGIFSLTLFFLLFDKNFWRTKLALLIPLILIPATILKFKNQDSLQYQHYLNYENSAELIKGFSLKFENTLGGYTQVLAGGGSWMSHTFYEVEKMLEENLWLKSFSSYFNDYLSLFSVITLLLITIAGFYLTIFKFRKFKALAWVLFLSFIFSFFLNFGFSTDFFQTINSWFFNIPQSYVFREGGKFYSIVLAIQLFSIILVYYFYRGLRWHTLLAISIIFVVNITPFLNLSKYLNQPEIPNIYSSQSEFIINCEPGQKVLYLPLTAYSLPNYSKEIFVINPDKGLINCNFYGHEMVFLHNQNGEVYSLTSFESNLTKSIEYFANLENPNFSDYIILTEALEKENVQTIITDNNNNSITTKFQNNLDIFKLPSFVEDSITIYNL